MLTQRDAYLMTATGCRVTLKIKGQVHLDQSVLVAL